MVGLHVFLRLIRIVHMRGTVSMVMMVTHAGLVQNRMQRIAGIVGHEPVARHGDSLNKQYRQKTKYDDRIAHGRSL